jgi:pantothenate kinase-related protein Tda10
MVSLILSSALTLAAFQATINAPRSAFVACLKSASAKAEGQKLAVGGYEAFLSSECSGPAGSLKSALVAFDVKNGIKRGAAESDAQLQLDDYYAMSKEKYEAKNKGAAPQP